MAIGVWFCSIDSKKSIRSGSGPFVVGAGLDAGAEDEEDPLMFGNDLDVTTPDPKTPLLAPAADEPPFFFASSSARYCLR